MQRIQLSESMNAGVHRIKRIWQSHATCSCRQICYIRRTLAFIVLFSLFVTFVKFVVQQYSPSMKDLSLPGQACHQLLRSLPLPSSPNAWAMGFNLHAFTRQSPCLCPPISMLLKGGFGIFVNALDFRQLCVKCQMPDLPSLACGMKRILKLNLPF